MKHKRLILTLALGLLFGRFSSAFCATVAGVVTNLQGQPVSGMEIVVQNSSKQVFGHALTDANGHYTIGNLSPETYDYVLDPKATGYMGGNAVSYLGPKGLTVNWKVSNSRGALALAAPGAGLTALGAASTVLLGGAVASGVAVGAYAGAGGFSHSNDTPSSSSE